MGARVSETRDMAKDLRELGAWLTHQKGPSDADSALCVDAAAVVEKARELLHAINWKLKPGDPVTNVQPEWEALARALGCRRHRDGSFCTYENAHECGRGHIWERPHAVVPQLGPLTGDVANDCRNCGEAPAMGGGAGDCCAPCARQMAGGRTYCKTCRKWYRTGRRHNCNNERDTQ